MMRIPAGAVVLFNGAGLLTRASARSSGGREWGIDEEALEGLGALKRAHGFALGVYVQVRTPACAVSPRAVVACRGQHTAPFVPLPAAGVPAGRAGGRGGDGPRGAPPRRHGRGVRVEGWGNAFPMDAGCAWCGLLREMHMSNRCAWGGLWGVATRDVRESWFGDFVNGTGRVSGERRGAARE